MLLRPTIDHPDLSGVLGDDTRQAMHMKLSRDIDGKPVDSVHIHSYAEPAVTKKVEKAIWDQLGVDEPVPPSLGMIEDVRDEPLALTQAATAVPSHPGPGGADPVGGGIGHLGTEGPLR